MKINIEVDNIRDKLDYELIKNSKDMYDMLKAVKEYRNTIPHKYTTPEELAVLDKNKTPVDLSEISRYYSIEGMLPPDTKQYVPLQDILEVLDDILKNFKLLEG